ncbi:LacI family transcriptional regulator [Consotaella salsifontis]|uniref:Transcriptional regulator, LacI family n=1 Tax=Consotaella salsifontis TaxID=1365950 RepID=A0A1T4MQ89_9HYPH|nr:transcriptional regulator, LacI family [Consotaella salsifontis]
MPQRGRPRKARLAAQPEVSGKPTLKTIADLAGLAVTTVSRALHDDPDIAEKTRLRVKSLASEIGYLPDRAALRLRTGRTYVVSLVLDPHDEILGFGISLIRGLTRAFRATPYHLIITPHFQGEPPLDPVSHLVRNRMADGIIFTHTEPFDERIRLLAEQDVPFVSHGRTEFTFPHPFVDFDNGSFALEAVRRLIARGSGRIAMIAPSRQFTFCQHMRHGFMTAVRETGVAFEIPDGIDLDSPAEQIRAYAFERAGGNEPVDGFVCGGEVSGLAVMAGLTDAGRTVGRDVHLVVKQTSPVFSQVRPQVDVIVEDLEEAGERMGELLLGVITDSARRDAHFLQPPRLSYVDG